MCIEVYLLILKTSIYNSTAVVYSTNNIWNIPTYFLNKNANNFLRH